MQTKGHIRQLLESAGIQPNKHFGQHFLIDLNLMRLLVDAADIKKDDVVLEVGCGTGSLTEVLAEKAGKVIAVEIDKALAGIAQKELAKIKNVEVINADVLESKHTLNPIAANALQSACESSAGRLLLVANLPYNAASPVILNLITGPLTADGMYVTIQKEVAERMAAGPGSKDYGVLSIFLAGMGEVKMLRTLNPSVFWPQPEVDSAMVSFIRSEEKVGRIKSVDLFKEVMNLFMGHRRKMLKACTKLVAGKLAEIKNWDEIFQRCSIDPEKRPEQISPQDYLGIANLCCEHLKL